MRHISSAEAKAAVFHKWKALQKDVEELVPADTLVHLQVSPTTGISPSTAGDVLVSGASSEQPKSTAMPPSTISSIPDEKVTQVSKEAEIRAAERREARRRKEKLESLKDKAPESQASTSSKSASESLPPTVTSQKTTKQEEIEIPAITTATAFPKLVPPPVIPKPQSLRKLSTPLAETTTIPSATSNNASTILAAVEAKPSSILAKNMNGNSHEGSSKPQVSTGSLRRKTASSEKTADLKEVTENRKEKELAQGESKPLEIVTSPPQKRATMVRQPESESSGEEEREEEEDDEDGEMLPVLTPELLTPEVHIGAIKISVSVPTMDFQSDLEQELAAIVKKSKKVDEVEVIRAAIKSEVGKMIEDIASLKGKAPRKGKQESEESSLSESESSSSESDSNEEDGEEEEDQKVPLTSGPKDETDRLLAKFAENSLKKAKDYEAGLNKPKMDKPTMPLPTPPPKRSTSPSSSPEKDVGSKAKTSSRQVLFLFSISQSFFSAIYKKKTFFFFLTLSFFLVLQL
jgi:hypothetical protein